MLACSTGDHRTVEIVRRADHSTARRVSQDVGVDHRRLDILVAEKLLDRPDVMAGHQKVGGEAVTEGVAAYLFGDAGRARCCVDRLADDRLMEVVAANGSSAGVGTAGAGR